MYVIFAVNNYVVHIELLAPLPVSVTHGGWSSVPRRTRQHSTSNPVQAVERSILFREALGGRFGGHLGEVKVHSELQRHYWWPEMRKNVSRWTRRCLVCATRSPQDEQLSHRRRPYIPVPGQFNHIGFDVIKFHDLRMETSTRLCLLRTSRSGQRCLPSLTSLPPR